jgi:hypothetical protein
VPHSFPTPGVLQGQTCAMDKYSKIINNVCRFTGGPRRSRTSAAWWNCSLEYRRGRDSLFSVNAVCYKRSVRRADPSSRGILPCVIEFDQVP